MAVFMGLWACLSDPKLNRSGAAYQTREETVLKNHNNTLWLVALLHQGSIISSCDIENGCIFFKTCAYVGVDLSLCVWGGLKRWLIYTIVGLISMNYTNYCEFFCCLHRKWKFAKWLEQSLGLQKHLQIVIFASKNQYICNGRHILTEKKELAMNRFCSQ